MKKKKNKTKNFGDFLLTQNKKNLQNFKKFTIFLAPRHYFLHL